MSSHQPPQKAKPQRLRRARRRRVLGGRRILFIGLGGTALGATLLSASMFSACIASAPEGVRPITDEDAGDDLINVGGGSTDASVDLGELDPHDLIGADPSHGPFAGGQRVLIHGNGFNSEVRVWFGDQEVDPSVVLPIDPTRVQVNAPPGEAGPADITVQNGTDASTQRILPGAYNYDALYAVPNSGPVSGGNDILIVGQGTEWDASTEASVDTKPCTTLVANGPTELRCTVPKGTPGAKAVQVTHGADTIVVLDAYAYEDSADGFKGGLSGLPLDGSMKVLVYNNFSGDAIPGAHAILGSDINTALIEQADQSGVATIDDLSLSGTVTVTVSAECHSPITFVDVPVDTVTVYLDPVLTPACAGDGDPPPVGGNGVSGGSVFGELVWGGGQEFQKGPWQIPAPQNANEKQRAYIFEATTNPLAEFTLPQEFSGVTPLDPGDTGYAFSVSLTPGNKTLYAIAGIEDRSVEPPRFIAYSMGIVRGVPVAPATITQDVFIQMQSPLDLALTMNVSPPAPGPSGPDRLRASVSVRLGNDGYAILPAGSQTPLLPTSGPLTFVGVPLLAGDLLGATYSSTARAVTGQSFTAPLSVVGRKLSTTTSQPVTIDGFVNLPTLISPTVNSAWNDRDLSTSFASGGQPVDLTVYDILAGGGLKHWVVAVPKGTHAVQVPDLRVFPAEALPDGPITIAVYGAHIGDFDYGQLRFVQLRPQGMTAYSLNFFDLHL